MNQELARQRAAQGLPPTIEDPAALAQIAAVVVGDGEGAAEATPCTTSRKPPSAGAIRPAPAGATHDRTPDR